MAQEQRGKVIEFKPRPHKKLKDVKYVNPSKKELLKEREREKKLRETQQQTIRNIGIFILICFVVYLIRVAF